jgi:hypothetical protein
VVTPASTRPGRLTLMFLLIRAVKSQDIGVSWPRFANWLKACICRYGSDCVSPGRRDGFPVALRDSGVLVPEGSIGHFGGWLSNELLARRVLPCRAVTAPTWSLSAGEMINVY